MTDSIETSEDEALPWVPPVDADDVHAMTYKLPPLPEPTWSTGLGVAYTSEQMQAYAIAAIEAQGVPDGWQLVRTDALKMAVGFAVPAMERDRDSPSNSAWMVEAAERNINAVRAMLASAPPASQAKPKPLTNDQKWDMWTAATIEQPSARGCYFRGVEDAEAAHGIQGSAA